MTSWWQHVMLTWHQADMPLNDRLTIVSAVQKIHWKNKSGCFKIVIYLHLRIEDTFKKLYGCVFCDWFDNELCQTYYCVFIKCDIIILHYMYVTLSITLYVCYIIYYIICMLHYILHYMYVTLYITLYVSYLLYNMICMLHYILHYIWHYMYVTLFITLYVCFIMYYIICMFIIYYIICV